MLTNRSHQREREREGQTERKKDEETSSSEEDTSGRVIACFVGEKKGQPANFTCQNSYISQVWDFY